MKLEIVAASGTRSAVREGAVEAGYPICIANSAASSNERERILMEQLPVVRVLARCIHRRLPKRIDLEDLISAGELGLMDALSKFDPAKKIQFRTYAKFRIRGAILDSLRTLDWGPRDLRRKGRAVEETIRALTQRIGRFPDDGEVAAEMALGLKEYQRLLRDLKGLEIGTLHQVRNEDSGEDEMAYLPSKLGEDPFSICLEGELKNLLSRAIANLPAREKLVSTLYYFLENTMSEIGLALGVTQARVSQIHSSAVAHLRAELNEPPVRGRFGLETARKEGPVAVKRTRTPLAA